MAEMNSEQQLMDQVFENQKKILALSHQIKKTKSNETNEYVEATLRLIQDIHNMLEDYKDTQLILGTTLQHNTQIENDLSYQVDLANKTSEKYEFIANSAHECMSLLNSDMTFEAVNDSFCKFFRDKV